MDSRFQVNVSPLGEFRQLNRKIKEKWESCKSGIQTQSEKLIPEIVLYQCRETASEFHWKTWMIIFQCALKNLAQIDGGRKFYIPLISGTGFHSYTSRSVFALMIVLTGFIVMGLTLAGELHRRRYPVQLNSFRKIPYGVFCDKDSLGNSNNSEQILVQFADYELVARWSFCESFTSSADFLVSRSASIHYAILKVFDFQPSRSHSSRISARTGSYSEAHISPEHDPFIGLGHFLHSTSRSV